MQERQRHRKVRYSCIMERRPPMSLHLHGNFAAKPAHSQATEGLARLIPGLLGYIDGYARMCQKRSTTE